MRRVLIISPNWPPISAPDFHRVRMALPYFREFGWEPLLLKIDPTQDFGFRDSELCRTVPGWLRTWQASYISLSFTAWAGLRSGSIRSIFHLARLGDRIIQQEKPQMVFFSTTMFPVMILGRYWLRRHGIPYMLDFQDPWRKAKAEILKAKTLKPEMEGEGARSEDQGAKIRPPTSALCSPSFKARLADWVAGILEPFALRRVAHVVSVSPAYPSMLMARYSWLRPEQCTVLPFGAAEADFNYLRSNPIQQTAFVPQDGKQHWVYVGACIPAMSLAVRSFLAVLNLLFQGCPELRGNLRVHFIGTSYAPKGRAVRTVEPLAREGGLCDVVSEVTDRIPYFEALQCLMDADALFVPGSDDPGYTASKIYPYILAQKPLLAVFHENSSVVEVLRSTQAGTVVTFKSGDDCETIAARILASGWLAVKRSEVGSQKSEVSGQWSGARPPVPQTDWQAFAPYTAREMSRKLCRVFDKAIAGDQKPDVRSQ